MSPKTLLITLVCALFPFSAMSACQPAMNIYPCDQQLYDKYPNSAMYYYGQTMDTVLINLLTFHGYRTWPEKIQSLEFEHTLCKDNFLRWLVSPLVGVVHVAGDITVRYGRHQHTIYEFSPYLMFRWANFPWNCYVNTSLALGEGVSYATSIPWIEAENNTNTKRLLNLLAFEATFAHPCYPQLQAVLRIHHRSGCYGLYHAGNSGSNDIGLGIRYLFD